MTQFIAGHWVDGHGAAMEKNSPVTGKKLWHGHAADNHQVSIAMQSAKEIKLDWYLLGLDKRIRLLTDAVNHMHSQQVKFINTISDETGKPKWEAQLEFQAALAKLDISIKAYHDRTGEHGQMGKGARLSHKPQGVMAVLGPFNFPMHLPLGHILPALLAGNCVIFKPSELTPHTAELIAQSFDAAKLPTGVFQLVQGGADTAKSLVNKPINGLCFTGSSSTGLEIQRFFAQDSTRIMALEMGGNNPLIISNFDDMDKCCYAIIQSAFITSGQRCTCTRRLYLPKGKLSDQLIERLVEICQKLKIGDPSVSSDIFMGGLITEQAAQSILAIQQEMLDKGGIAHLAATIVKEGSSIISPAIIELDSTKWNRDEEYFGPLLQVYRYQNLDEAIMLANNTRYGLAAGFIGKDRQEYEYVYARLNVGILNWNKPTTGASSAAPFGGVGDSGNFRPSAYYAADYCAYPVASFEGERLELPEALSPGVILD